MGAAILYDTKCRDLADAFLEDSPHLNTEARAVELAGVIQVAIQDYIQHEEDNYQPPDPPGWEGGFAENH